MDRQTYLNSIKNKVKKNVGQKESKVEKDIISLVKDMMSKKEVTTISQVTKELGKVKNYGSYVRRLVEKSEELEFVKINGINIIVTK